MHLSNCVLHTIKLIFTENRFSTAMMYNYCFKLLINFQSNPVARSWFENIKFFYHYVDKHPMRLDVIKLTAL